MKNYITLTFLFISCLCSSQVIINEVQSSNSTTIADNNGEYEDWIELYNPNDFAVDIGGLVLKDQVDVWQIPTDEASTLLQPYSYFLLWCDDEVTEGAFHTNFKISASNGEYIGLFESDSTTEIESVNVPVLGGDQSYGKCNGEWTLFNTASPMDQNDCGNSGIDLTELNFSEIVNFNQDGELIVCLPSSSTGTKSLRVYSLVGRLLLHQEFHTSYYIGDLSGLNNDVYLVQIQTGDYTYSAGMVMRK